MGRVKGGSRPRPAVERDGKRFVSVREAAAQIGCSVDTVRRLAHAGTLHGYRPRSDSDEGWMEIESRSLERFIARRRSANFHGGKRAKRR